MYRIILYHGISYRIMYVMTYYIGVCEETPSSANPLPCNPLAETALRPLIWCFESPSAQESFSFAGLLCSHAPAKFEDTPTARFQTGRLFRKRR